MTTKYLRFGDWTSNSYTRQVEVQGLQDLRNKIREEKIKTSPKVKLGELWGRKWADYLGVAPSGETVYLCDEYIIELGKQK